MIPPVWSVGTSWPFSASHTFAVWSSLPVTMRRPSGLNATLPHPACVTLEGEEFLARPGVPHLHGLVLAAGDDASAVGAERHAPHPACVPLEGEEFLARLGVPHLQPYWSSLPVTMRLPSGLNATLRTPPGVPLEGEDLAARLGIPHLRRSRHR